MPLLPLIKFEAVEHLSLEAFVAAISSCPRVRVGSLTLEDFCAAEHHPNGVYVFFEFEKGDQTLYVGKVSSRSFLGRLPSHFEPKREYWMNYFSRRIADVECSSDYSRGVRSALSKYVVFIGFEAVDTKPERELRTKRICALESVLRTKMAPTLNKHVIPIVDGATVSALVACAAQAVAHADPLGHAL